MCDLYLCQSLNRGLDSKGSPLICFAQVGAELAAGKGDPKTDTTKTAQNKRDW